MVFATSDNGAGNSDPYATSKKYFPTTMQFVQFLEKYSRYNYDEKRRESWPETVTRAVNQLKELSYNQLPQADYDRIYDAILNLKVMPSMRLLAMAGTGLSHATFFNCSYMAVEDLYSFVEALILSMNGCGVGFSVEREYVQRIPVLWPPEHPTGDWRTYMRYVCGLDNGTGGFFAVCHGAWDIRKDEDGEEYPVFMIEDSAEGWAQALWTALQMFQAGHYNVQFDYSYIRPAGAPLRRKGGQASGPEALRRCIEKIRSIMYKASRSGGKLSTLNAHDMMCHIGSCAVSGGVRRSAMISLFDFDDEEMRHCKDGDFEKENNQRWNANNSAVWPEDRELNQQEVFEQMAAMYANGRGEPGIFNRRAVNNTLPARRIRLDANGKPIKWGTNPCAEIILKNRQMCNLSAVKAEADDTFETLRDKVEVATIIGTIQSMATDFPGLRQEWKRNCEEERLLGVDVTGQMDCPQFRSPDTKRRLRDHAVQVNNIYARKLGINPSACVTTGKPSGNSSVLLNCSSGIHPRWSKFYFRYYRIGAASPVYQVLKQGGVPLFKENGQEHLPDEQVTTWVAQFPIKSPENAVTRDDISCLAHCDEWLNQKLYWCEHNQSVTINYEPNDALDLAVWVWVHQDEIGGMAFLPKFVPDSKMRLLAYVEITEAEYYKAMMNFPTDLPYHLLAELEQDKDMTTVAQEFACLANGTGCETV